MINQTEPMPALAQSIESGRVRLVKRYRNRKLYDTQRSCYVTLEDISKMVCANLDVMVVDKHSKSNITAATLVKIIFEAEKKAAQYAPIFTLREIIQNGRGKLSDLVKLGVFPRDQLKAWGFAPMASLSSAEILQNNLEQRVVTAAARNITATNLFVKGSAQTGSLLPEIECHFETLNLRITAVQSIVAKMDKDSPPRQSLFLTSGVGHFWFFRILQFAFGDIDVKSFNFC